MSKGSARGRSFGRSTNGQRLEVPLSGMRDGGEKCVSFEEISTVRSSNVLRVHARDSGTRSSRFSVTFREKPFLSQDLAFSRDSHAASI